MRCPEYESSSWDFDIWVNIGITDWSMVFYLLEDDFWLDIARAAVNIFASAFGFLSLSSLYVRSSWGTCFISVSPAFGIAMNHFLSPMPWSGSMRGFWFWDESFLCLPPWLAVRGEWVWLVLWFCSGAVWYWFMYWDSFQFSKWFAVARFSSISCFMLWLRVICAQCFPSIWCEPGIEGFILPKFGLIGNRSDKPV